MLKALAVLAAVAAVVGAGILVAVWFVVKASGVYEGRR